ncbi:MAG: ATP-binding cassette domain-containing protein, partial [Acidobacteriota bacterium]
RVLDDLWSLAPGRNQTELRNLLGCFLFSADDVFKPIRVLSGGERNRYALARMLLHPANFLLMDEPTNHLDLRAKDVLLEALEKYTGTIVFVSHDRYFIDQLATRVFEIGGGEVKVYPGNYEDYRWRKEREASEESEETPHPLARTPAAMRAGHSPEADPAAVRPKRINPIKLRQIKDRREELEEQIARGEAEIADCETALQTFVSAAETARLTDLLAARRNELERLLAEWTEVSEALESAAVADLTPES